MALDVIQDLRTRLLPMLRAAAMQYENRAPNGYPNVIDSPQSGTIGIELDPSHALYFVRDADGLAARMYRRASRTDSRANAGRQKYAGVPYSDSRPLDANVDDQTLRNLIAELMSYHNAQPGLLYITDD